MEERKKSHIELAFESQTPAQGLDHRFSYEPALSGHPQEKTDPFIFLGKKFSVPLWVSSMTGGTSLARTINTNLAHACREFGFGMGLGSCRILLEDRSRLPDFDMRDLIGDDNAFFANLGIAQIEEAVTHNRTEKIHELVKRLRADGLIIHINPLQEWVQPEGDRLKHPPVETISKFLEKTSYDVIVKEVGQGMGKESLRALLDLPLAAIEFAAFGGTNFTMLELMRREPLEQKTYEPFSHIGVDAVTMVNYVNEIVGEQGNVKCSQLIISGGIHSYLDGYYLIGKSKLPAIYGQASAFLRFARESYDTLHSFIEGQIEGLQMARAYLRIKDQ